ncbi:thiamine pyrophosphate-binding protein [Acidianus manzaensis]|uniref:2-oxoacid oxidoreductase (ferredoxin) n=1 Tax=Acidianus manzaensis TaxID=282676 RepID=A0A1W6JZ57_9CREN|nr:thiamine pyrophosphate-binding protein [Acidianus manzaensis]ARM75538.1 acetolactate synthase [Acidianus manzaensis]
MKNLAGVLLDYISSQVDDVFGIPGTHGLSLYEELRKKVTNGKLRYFMPRLEYGGTIMADYYARIKNNVGIFFSVNGPGFTNSLTGVAQAYSEGSPLILISLNKELKYRDKRQLHDMGYFDAQMEIARQITKASFRIYSPNDVPNTFEKAFRIALEDKMGPVYIEIPVDLLDIEVGEEKEVKFSKINRSLIYPTEDEVKETLDFLSSCNKPTLLLGYGASRSNIVNYIEKLGLPVITTIRGKGAIPENHPLFMGTLFGMKEIPGDCLIAIGTSFNDLETGRWSIKLPEKILHVDPDISVFNVGELGIKASAEAFLKEITEKLEKITWSTYLTKKEDVISLDENDKISHDFLARVLDSNLDQDRIVISDAGTNQVMAMDIKIYKPNSYFNSLIFNAMGSAIPAGIGTKIASPERQVVSIIGDAGFQACFNELITAVENNIGFLSVLVEDGVQHFLRLNQKIRYGNTFSTDVYSVDYTKIVDSIGVKAFEAKTKDELKEVIDDAIKWSHKKPTLLRVHVDPNSIPSRLRK